MQREPGTCHSGLFQQECLARASQGGWRGHSRWHGPTDFAGVTSGPVDPWDCHCVTKTCEARLRTGVGLVWATWPRAGGPRSPGSASPAGRISDKVTGAQGSLKGRCHRGTWTPVTSEKVVTAPPGREGGRSSCRTRSSGVPPGGGGGCQGHCSQGAQGSDEGPGQGWACGLQESLSHRMSRALPPGTRCLAEEDSGTAGFSRGRWPGQWGAGTLGTGLGSGWRHRSQQLRTITESHWPACPPRASALPGRRVGQLGAVTRALPHLLKGCPRPELSS